MSSEKKTQLEEDTRAFFGKWHRWFLKRALTKLLNRADELHDSTWGRATCGCFVDENTSNTCLWHDLQAYMR